MYSYIKGTIVEMHTNHIVIENNGIGYLVYVPNPYTFTKGENTTVYIYQSVSENDVRLYGFKEAKQKDLFLMLIKVKGIGPKSATAILASGDVNEIIDAIENNNLKYLKSFPGNVTAYNNCIFRFNNPLPVILQTNVIILPSFKYIHRL